MITMGSLHHAIACTFLKRKEKRWMGQEEGRLGGGDWGREL